jgi:hypothetical protein
VIKRLASGARGDLTANERQPPSVCVQVWHLVQRVGVKVSGDDVHDRILACVFGSSESKRLVHPHLGGCAVGLEKGLHLAIAVLCSRGWREVHRREHHGLSAAEARVVDFDRKGRVVEGYTVGMGVRDAFYQPYRPFYDGNVHLGVAWPARLGDCKRPFFGHIAALLLYCHQGHELLRTRLGLIGWNLAQQDHVDRGHDSDKV